MKSCLPICLALLATACLHAQTITPNESQILLQAPKKIGMNLNGPTFYQGGEIYKNLLWRNPGFEPDLYRDKFVAFVAGTTTAFQSSDIYDPVAQNFWTGATFKLYRGTPRILACSGTIAGNTVSANNLGPAYQFATACPSAVQEGDVIILRQAVPCTSEASWEVGGGGWWGFVQNGGKLISECAAPYDGAQSLRLDASVAGSTAGVNGYVDSNPTDAGILINGQYAISGMYKTIGSPTLSVGAHRFASSATGNPLNCPTQTFAASSGWTTFTVSCPGSETKDVAPNAIVVEISSQGGIVLLDNISFQKSAGTDPTNKTVFRDEVLATLKAHCAGASLSTVPCELRDWAGQNADEIANSVKPLFERRPTIAGTAYDVPPNDNSASMSVSFEEFLELCEAIDAEPYYALPETTGPDDASNWMEYLNGSVATPYGSIRAANGHSASWLSTFPTIHLPMGNENWNEGGGGDRLGYRADAPDYYYDYSVDTAGVWAAMRSSASWPTGGVGIDLILGFQNGNANYGVNEAMQRANPTSGELAPYTQAYVGDTATLPQLWNPLLYEVVANTTNSAVTFYQQGSAIKSHGKLNVYEFDNGTSAGSSSLTQAVLDRFTDAAGYGTATALQGLQHLTFGVVDQNFWSLDQYAFGIPGLGLVHNWGAVIDMGGATNAVRPQELGMRMANAAIIGPMYACPIASPSTYNLTANHNGADSSGEPATNDIPQEYAYCFLQGTARSMIVINTDISATHAISFAGKQSPSGNVTLTRYAPTSISLTNEATAGNSTDLTPQNVTINAPITVTNPTSDTLPPYSITRYDWTTTGSSFTETTTSLTASTLAPPVGTSLTLQATVSSPTATGNISLYDGSTLVSTQSLTDGASFFAIASITPGIHDYSVVYAGNTVYATSTSPTVAVNARVFSQITLNPSTTTPVGGSKVTLTAKMSPTAITGTLNFYDGTTLLGAGSLAEGQATYVIASIKSGPHSYTAAFAGNATYAPAMSNTVVVNASLTPTTVYLAPGSVTPAIGSINVLIAAVSNSSATGSVTFKDGTATLATLPVAAGTALYLVPVTNATSHRYTATYGGSSSFSGSTSANVTVNPVTASPYLQTTFQEHASGTALNGTTPAVGPAGSTWSDSNGDWRFAVNGIVSNTADLTNPTLIDTTHADYAAIFNLPAYGAHLFFRYVDLGNTLFVVTYQSEIDLYATVQGTTTKLTTIYPQVTSGTVTVEVAGGYAAISAGGQTAAAILPPALIKGTKLGFYPGSSGFVISGLTVIP